MSLQTAENNGGGVGREMTEQLRAWTVLAKDPSFSLSPHVKTLLAVIKEKYL